MNEQRLAFARSSHRAVHDQRMDLRSAYPRSPYAMMSGIVSLPRVIDKAHANNEGTLGVYDVNCPHDQPVLAFLGVDFAAFSARIKALAYDDRAIEAWTRPLVDRHSPADIAEFNRSRREWTPDAHSQPTFDALLATAAPGRTDVKTWFALLDLDEKRVATPA
jgi:hypothetical protein